MTRGELADCAGCSVSTLRKIEVDERRPSKQLAGLLANCLQVTPEELPAFVQAARGDKSVIRFEGTSLESGRFKPVFQKTSMATGASLSTKEARGVAPARSLPLDNLPLPFAPLVGREYELLTLAQLLADPACRWLTLVGPGGIGKTRLSVEAARNCRENFADGACFVPLAPLNSPDLILPTIAGALGYRFFGPADPGLQLRNYLNGKAILIILDSAEHLLGANQPEEQFRKVTGLLTSILQSAPGVKIIVTSRERLCLQDEWLFEVRGLPFPSDGDSQGLEESSAYNLFLQSARRILPDYRPQESDRKAIGQICQLLEGMPLGIELAASWMRLLPCEEILQEIKGNLDFLGTNLRDIPERHRSLRAVFDHSWNLLSEEEQRALSRISVFRGGFHRQDAERVTGTNLETLSALAGKSFLYRTESGTYDLHELVRQYAWERLAENPLGAQDAREKHSAYFLARLCKRESGLSSSHQKEILGELNAEIDNLRAAWEWAVSHPQASLLRYSLKAIWHFYGLQDWFQEGAAVCEAAIQALRHPLPGEPCELLLTDQAVALGRALAEQGWFYFRMGQMGMAGERLRESVAILRSQTDRAALGFALLALGDFISTTRNDLEGRALIEESLAIHQELGDPWFVSLAMNDLAIGAFFRGEVQEAYGRFQDSLPVTRAVGDPSIISFCLSFFSLACTSLGKYTEARSLLEKSLSIARASSSRWDMAIALDHLGVVAKAQGDYPEAVERFRESLALFAELGEKFSQARVLDHLGEMALEQGDVEAAWGYFIPALGLAKEAGATPVLLSALLGLAQLEAQEGNRVSALSAALAVRDHTASDGETKESARQLSEDLRLQLAPEEVEKANSKFIGKDLDEIIAELRLASSK